MTVLSIKLLLRDAEGSQATKLSRSIALSQSFSLQQLMMLLEQITLNAEELDLSS